jgi:hypothetical protein
VAEVLCWTCEHRRAIPGNAHVRCGARVPDGDTLGEAVALLMPKGFGFANFDPSFPRPITTCAFYAREPATAPEEQVAPI